MKIFLISNMYPSQQDKLFGVFIKNTKQELEKQGVIFSKVAILRGKYNNLLKKCFRYTKHYLRILFLFSFWNSTYDLIYIHFITHHIPVLLLLLPFKRKPWIINAHGQDIITLLNNPKLDFFGKKILKNIDLFVVPSNYFKNLVEDHYSFLNDSHIFVSPSGGIDREKFYHIDQQEKPELFTLGFVSRLIKEKGWETFLESIVLLRERKINIRAIIAGKGPDEQKIKTYIEQHELQDSVEFLGFVKQDELVNLYNKLDLYIFPTYRKSESLGLTGLEAMACGTPVIACDNAGPSTYIDHGKNGFLFPPQDSKELADKIRFYQKLNKPEQQKIERKALATSRDYHRDRVAKSLIEKLEVLIDG